jgi:hypothetical protein
MRNNNIVKKSLAFCTLLAIAISSIGCSKKDDVTNIDTKYVSASYAVDMNNPEEVIGICSNVFIGYVEDMTDTYYISNFPYTRYNVKVINNIKGELPLDTTVLVNKEGGVLEDLSCYILFENDFLPEEGEYYVFNVRERSEDASFTASGINTAVLVNDIDMQNLTDDISNNSNSLNLKEDNVISELENSDIYQKYVDAYKNQKVFDPKK